ncbi:PhzF family phenazine biosynthesis protein [bacterium]|nr:PhzF family phenazine biosynthesis protein [bacterium]
MSRPPWYILVLVKPFDSPLTANYELIDAFAIGPFSGNPAAVIMVDSSQADRVTDRDLQLIAAEFNLSETAFLWQRNVPDEWTLRWFSPTTEVNLCGHATLAAASFLSRRCPGSRWEFHTRSGCLSAVQSPDGDISLDFPETQLYPADPERVASCHWGDGLEMFVAGEDLLVVGPHRQWVADFSDDGKDLVSITQRGVIITAPGDHEYDCVSRFFAPKCGINEDPVTGSAHCALAPYWQRRLGVNHIIGYQLSPRGGIVRAAASGGRVTLSGATYLIAEGRIRL